MREHLKLARENNANVQVLKENYLLRLVSFNLKVLYEMLKLFDIESTEERELLEEMSRFLNFIKHPAIIRDVILANHISW